MSVEIRLVAGVTEEWLRLLVKRCASTDGGYGVIDHKELDGKGPATGVVDINAVKVLV